MAKDKNGRDLQQGDLVSLACRVVGVHDGSGYAIAMLEPAEPCGGNVHTRTFGVNALQVELPVKEAAPADVAPQPPTEALELDVAPPAVEKLEEDPDRQ